MKMKIGDQVLRFSNEALPEFRILGGNTNRTGIQMAFAHHDTAQGNQRCGGKAEFLGTQQSGIYHIPAGFQLAVRLQDNPVAQVIDHKGLLNFRNTEFHGQSGIFDGTGRTGPGSSFTSADGNAVGMCFGNTGGNSSDSFFRNQFYIDPGPRVGAFQVKDQLGQVFDGIDIVMRRRGYQGYTRSWNAAIWQ